MIIRSPKLQGKGVVIIGDGCLEGDITNYLASQGACVAVFSEDCKNMEKYVKKANREYGSGSFVVQINLKGGLGPCFAEAVVRFKNGGKVGYPGSYNGCIDAVVDPMWVNKYLPHSSETQGVDFSTDRLKYIGLKCPKTFGGGYAPASEAYHYLSKAYHPIFVMVDRGIRMCPNLWDSDKPYKSHKKGNPKKFKKMVADALMEQWKVPYHNKIIVDLIDAGKYRKIPSSKKDDFREWIAKAVIDLMWKTD